MVRILDWDSTFFNLKVGEINLDNDLSLDEVTNFDLLYVISKNEFDSKIDNFEKTFEEVKVKFSKKPEYNNFYSEAIFSLENINYNIEDLYQLAFESGKNSRFLLDKKFNENQFKDLYKLWVENSISKKFATDVLVYVENSEIQGFVTYKIENTNASVGLIAVNSNSQGKGIGGKLLQYLENILSNNEVKELTIPTQLANEPACNFYTKQKYSIEKTTYIKHYWKNDSI